MPGAPPPRGSRPAPRPGLCQTLPSHLACLCLSFPSVTRESWGPESPPSVLAVPVLREELSFRPPGQRRGRAVPRTGGGHTGEGEPPEGDQGLCHPLASPRPGDQPPAGLGEGCGGRGGCRGAAGRACLTPAPAGSSSTGRGPRLHRSFIPPAPSWQAPRGQAPGPPSEASRGAGGGVMGLRVQSRGGQPAGGRGDTGILRAPEEPEGQPAPTWLQRLRPEAGSPSFPKAQSGAWHPSSRRPPQPPARKQTHPIARLLAALQETGRRMQMAGPGREAAPAPSPRGAACRRAGAESWGAGSCRPRRGRPAFLRHLPGLWVGTRAAREVGTGAGPAVCRATPGGGRACVPDSGLPRAAFPEKWGHMGRWG